MENFLNNLKTPGIFIVKPKLVGEIQIASALDLKDLVVENNVADARLGCQCSPDLNSEMTITFDHVEPISKIRYRTGAYSVGNVQMHAGCLNHWIPMTIVTPPKSQY